MRQLKIASAPLPPEKRAQALALLTQLRTHHPFPLATLNVSEEHFFTFLISLAQQYPGDWESLLTAGYMAAARAVEIYADRLDRVDKYFAHWVREGMIEASKKLNN